ncbi:MAG: nucleotidyl transferase AbiEii/AbiGii toxin family protein [Candidatus Giovannonibacteria bacterium]|nr:nucleotidyl transferase AbiEii/AbiGii toxin family protein [Candidatus Giovannonibacteria bacterium]
MAKIITFEQDRFLELAGKSQYLRDNFYFTGGTPLAVFYLQHRLSEDIDLFIEDKEVPLNFVSSFIKKIGKVLGIQKTDYTNFLGLHSFQLYFSKTNILKVDFNYYPFPRIEKGIKYKNIEVDSILDIAVNKVHTIAMKPRARDFIDIYFIIKEKGYRFNDLLKKAKIKFDWHIDPLQLGSRLFMAREVKDFPRMIKKIDHKEWQNFFFKEAKKLKSDILV